MKSKMTKFATAAILVATVLLSMIFLDKAVTPAYAEFVEILRNSTNKEWLYVVIQKHKGFRNKDEWIWVEPNKSEQQDEVWFSLQPFRQFRKSGNGHISLDDYAGQRSYGYSPESKTLTIEYENAPDLVHEYQTQGIHDALSLSVPNDGKILKKQEEVNGKSLTVFYKKTPSEGYEQWFVDTETNLIIKYEEVDYEDQERLTLVYSYPERGPADIYELGVPRDAKVVNLVPDREIEELVNNARVAEQRFSNTFFAIECKILESFENSLPPVKCRDGRQLFQEDTRLYDTMNVSAVPAAVITVTYRKGENGRRDIYPIWIHQYSDLEDYQEQLKEIKKTIPVENDTAMEAWIQSRLPSQIIISNNRDMSIFQLDPGGRLDKVTQRYDPRDRAVLLNVNFWRPPNNRYDLDHYCQPLTNQRSQWGELTGIIIGDEKYHCYYNPDRDYICERTAKGFDESKQSHEYAKDVLEYAKTPSGYWYPKKSFSTCGKASYLFVSHIDDNCLVDDELFDEDILSPSHLESLDSK
ncbi:MAG: hypothetical protein JXI43_14340 [Tissierellales bacterium]|nr:hypothetical protein [Tissierellales bacterium]